MGVYIKGVDMPKDCTECFMRLQCDGHHFEMEQDVDGFWMPKGVKDDCLFIEAEEPKRGEWVYGEHDVAMCDGYRCDKCGFFVPWDYEHKFIDFINDYHFCPNCGADMRGKDDGQRDTDRQEDCRY